MTNPGTQPEGTDEAQTSGGCGCCHSDSAELGTPDAGAPGPEGVAPTDDEQSPAPEDSAAGCCQSGVPATDSDSDASTDGEGHECCHTASPEEQLAEAIDSQQRIAAEFANYRRRTERDRVSIGAVAKISVLSELLPIIDDLDLANKHGDLTGPLKAVNDKLRGVFTKYEVTQFGTEGDDFNPELHEAVQDLSEGDTKVVGTVLRHGYMMGDRLIRTAMVIIADPAEH